MDDQPVCDEMAKFAPLGSFLGGNTQAVQAHTTLDKAVVTIDLTFDKVKFLGSFAHFLKRVYHQGIQIV